MASLKRYLPGVKGKGHTEMLLERTAGTIPRARELVLQHGWNTTSYQILNPGFSYWFDPTGDAVAGVVPAGRVWVVGGAPVCAAHRLTEVSRQLEHDAHRVGARVCYVAAQRRLEEARGDDADVATLRLGAEPFWDPRRWPEILAGHASLRAQLARARNKEVSVAPMSAATVPLDQMRAAQAHWLDAKQMPPLGFLTTPWLLDAMGDRRVFVATRGGALVGYLILTPVPGRGGWLAEQIVRTPDAPNGTAELLVDAAFRALASEGAAFISLGIVPLSTRAGGDDDAPWWLRALFGLARAHGRRFYNFDGLDRFKAKFEPSAWEPVYAMANSPKLSPTLLWGILSAVLGGPPAPFLLALSGRAVRTEWRRIRK